MKSNANQARELRSSLAPCSLLGFRDPTFFLMGTQVHATGRHSPPQAANLLTLGIMRSREVLVGAYQNHLKSLEPIENRRNPTQIKPGSSDPALLLAPC